MHLRFYNIWDCVIPKGQYRIQISSSWAINYYSTTIIIIARTALWALVIPSSRPESTRTFLAQKVLWQLQLGVRQIASTRLCNYHSTSYFLTIRRMVWTFYQVCVADGWTPSKMQRPGGGNVQMERKFSPSHQFPSYLLSCFKVSFYSSLSRSRRTSPSEPCWTLS